MDQLREAIEELFYFEFVLDDIPIWGFVGYLEESGFLPHSHKVQLLRCKCKLFWTKTCVVAFCGTTAVVVFSLS